MNNKYDNILKVMRSNVKFFFDIFLRCNYLGIQLIDITCNFFIIFTINPKVPLTVSPRQFKIFAQMPKLSSWNV